MNVLKSMTVPCISYRPDKNAAIWFRMTDFPALRFADSQLGSVNTVEPPFGEQLRTYEG